MGSVVVSDADLVRCLKGHFGHSAFRERQLEVVRSILSKRDCMVMMATGRGKSLCYQLPVLAVREHSPGSRAVSVCISPLVSLMTDQVEGLTMHNIKACLLGGNTTAKVEAEAMEGKYDMIYMTPEKVQGWGSKLRALHATYGIVCLAIDESHCVVEWGHDFRPDYQRLSFLREELPDVPIVALTATATRTVQGEIIRSLRLRDPLVVRTTVNRPNIHYTVKTRSNNRINDLSAALLRHPGSTIIYVLTRKEAEELAALINTGLKISAGAYHGEMSLEMRRAVHLRWSRDEVRVMVATLAFGMGIDKGDVRLIINYGLPKSIEAYYQQTGRAGRDGQQSYAVMYWDHSDVQRQLAIASRGDFNGSASAGGGGANTARVSVIETLMRQMESFADQRECRRQALLAYFNDSMTGACEGCDNCDRLAARSASAAANGPVIRGALTIDEYSDAVRMALQAVSKNARRGMKKVIETISKDNAKKASQRSKQWWEALIHQLASQEGLLARETHSMNTQGSSWNTVYTSFALTPTGRTFLSSSSTKLSTFEASTALYDAERSIRAEAQRKAAIATQQAAFEADRKPLIEEKKAQAAREQEALFQRLKQRQMKLASQFGVAAYTIQADGVLRDMATRRPTCLAALSTIDGWNEIKLQRYGTAFVEEIKAACDEMGLATDIDPNNKLQNVFGGLVDKITPAMQATYYAFMQERRSVDDIATNRTGGARERPCKPGTIRSYLARMAEAGNPLDWQRADLPSTVLPAVDTALKALQEQGVDGLSLPSRTSEVRLHCPPDTEWGDVAFALAYLRHTKATQGKSPGAHAASSAGGTPSTSGSTATAGGTAGTPSPSGIAPQRSGPPDLSGWIGRRSSPSTQPQPRPPTPSENKRPYLPSPTPSQGNPPAPAMSDNPRPLKLTRLMPSSSPVPSPPTASPAPATSKLYRPSYAAPSNPPLKPSNPTSFSQPLHPPPTCPSPSAPPPSPSPLASPPPMAKQPPALTSQAVICALQRPEGLTVTELRNCVPGADRLGSDDAIRAFLAPLEMEGVIYADGPRYKLL